LVKSTLRPTPRLSTWKTIPPGECRLGRDIHGFLPRYPSFVNFVAVTFSVHDHTRVPMLGTSEVGIATIYCKHVNYVNYMLALGYYGTEVYDISMTFGT